MSEFKNNLACDNIEINTKTMDILESCINVENGNYSNVGVIGDYGSGKSSTINSFITKYNEKKDLKKIREINISIASFFKNEFNNKDDSSDFHERLQLQSNEIRKNIVYLLIENLHKKINEFKFYNPKKYYYKYILSTYEISINYSKNNISGINIIKVRNFCFSIILMIFIYISLINLLGVHSGTSLYNSSIIIVGTTTIYTLFAFSLGNKIKNIRVGNVLDTSVENIVGFLDEDTNSIIGLLKFYITINKGYHNLLIIEDLDRFNNKLIFEELYQISNIIEELTFMYALRNNNFDNTTDINKFFDVVVDILSTRDNLFLEEQILNDFKDGPVIPSVITKLSPKIIDLRQYNRIYNRYFLLLSNYSNICNINIEYNELFTIATLKELYYEHVKNECTIESNIFKTLIENYFNTKSLEMIYEELSCSESKSSINVINNIKAEIEEKNYNYEKLELSTKIKIVHDHNKTICDGVDLDLIEDLIENGYLTKNWENYLVINNIDDEIMVNQKKIRINFRQKNGSISLNNVLYEQENNSLNTHFLSLFSVIDFKKRVELINPYIVLYLWKTNIENEEKLKAIIYVMYENRKFKDVVQTIFKVFDEVKPLLSNEKNIVEKYRLNVFMDDNLSRLLIDVHKQKSEYNIIIIRLLYIACLKGCTSLIAKSYLVEKLDDLNDKKKEEQVINTIVEEDNIIKDLEKFSKLSYFNENNNFFYLSDDFVLSSCYEKSIENITFLIKNNVVHTKILEMLKNKMEIDLQIVSNYIIKNLDDIMLKCDSVDEIVLHYLLEVESLDIFSKYDSIVNLILENNIFIINMENLSFLFEKENFYKLSEIIVENDVTNLFELADKNRVQRLLSKAYENTEGNDDKEIIINTYAKKGLLKINKEIFLFCYKNNIELTSELIEKYDQEFIQFLFSDWFMECENGKKEEIILSINSEILKKYLNIYLQNNISGFFEEFGLIENFTFPESGEGSKMKCIENSLFNVYEIDLKVEIINQSLKNGYIKSFNYINDNSTKIYKK